MMHPNDLDQPPAELSKPMVFGLAAFLIFGALITILGLLSLFSWIASLF